MNLIKKLSKKNLEVDKRFIQNIAPMGGVKFHEQYIQKADGYECSLYVYDYPLHVQENWISFLKKYLKHRKSVIYLSFEPVETEMAVKSINKAIAEQKSRIRSIQSNPDMIAKANQNAADLKHLLSSINNHGEKMFYYALRVMMCAEKLSDLEEEVSQIKQRLQQKGMQATILMNEQANEWKAPFRMLSKDTLYRRKGVMIPSVSLASTYPFSYSYLDDPRGMRLGVSDDGGQIIFDLFHKSETRLSYNMFISGVMGSGKSTLLKLFIQFCSELGHTPRIIDPVGENIPLVELYGGKEISLDGKNGLAFNPLHVTEVMEDGESQIGISISKAETFLNIIAPELNGHELSLFSKILKRIYSTNVAPIFSDVLEEIKKDLSKDLSAQRRNQYENLQLQIEKIVDVYGHLFNQPTTIDTLKEQIIVYTMRDLVQAEEKVYQAQMFNVMSSLWNELVSLGKSQWEAYKQGNLMLDDVKYYPVFIDEAHQIINTQNPLGVRYAKKFMKESRKYFGGIIYATQLLTEMVNPSKEKISEVEKDIMSLFELTQYKFIMKQDTSAIEIYQDVFKGQFNERELSRIPYFRQGECFLNISGDSNYHIHISCTAEQLKIFGGGR